MQNPQKIKHLECLHRNNQFGRRQKKKKDKKKHKEKWKEEKILKIDTVSGIYETKIVHFYSYVYLKIGADLHVMHGTKISISSQECVEYSINNDNAFNKNYVYLYSSRCFSVKEIWVR